MDFLDPWLAALSRHQGALPATFALELPRAAVSAAVDAALQRRPPGKVEVRNVSIVLVEGLARIVADLRTKGEGWKRILNLVPIHAELSVRDLELRTSGKDLHVSFVIAEPLEVPNLETALTLLGGFLPFDPRVLRHEGERVPVPLHGALEGVDDATRKLLGRVEARSIRILPGRLRLELDLGSDPAQAAPCAQ